MGKRSEQLSLNFVDQQWLQANDKQRFLEIYDRCIATLRFHLFWVACPRLTDVHAKSGFMFVYKHTVQYAISLSTEKGQP